MRILTSSRKRNVPFSTQTFDFSATREGDQIEKWPSIKYIHLRSCRLTLPECPHLIRALGLPDPTEVKGGLSHRSRRVQFRNVGQRGLGFPQRDVDTQ